MKNGTPQYKAIFLLKIRLFYGESVNFKAFKRSFPS